MSLVNILNVELQNNPAPFLAPLQFEITFEVVSELKDDIEFKVIYVGSALSESHDQVLESVMVGPLPVGVSKFVLEAPPPNPDQIPKSDALGVTVVLVSALYFNQEFVRVGYYVNNEFQDEALAALYASEEPPTTIDFGLLFRNILADKPKVTRFPISWDGPAGANTQSAGETGQANAPQ
ncbi:histone chaperone [Entophlyctis helioformis]|nr:histone chaperone [Entophlyctis helioformis]